MAEQDPLPTDDAVFSDAPLSDGEASPIGRAEVQETAARGDLEPRWLLLAGALAIAFLALLLWWRPGAQPATPLTPAASPVAPELTAQRTSATAPTATPVLSAAVLPTSTPTPVTEAALALPTATPTTLVLPTATPTALPSELLQRSLDVSGRISLTLTLQNASFQSDGRPLRFAVDRRTYRLNPANPEAEEHWCQQLGVVHLRGDLRYTLDSSTGDVRADGSLKLISDFCDAPGVAQYIAPVSLLFPVDSVTPVVQQLALSRRLFDSPGLLDSQAVVGLELTVINSLAE